MMSLDDVFPYSVFDFPEFNLAILGLSLAAQYGR